MMIDDEPPIEIRMEHCLGLTPMKVSYFNLRQEGVRWSQWPAESEFSFRH